MPTLLQEALRGGQSLTLADRPAPRAIVVAGGGGAIGSAVLERLLASPRFSQVHVLVTQTLRTGMPGLNTVLAPQFSPAAESEPPPLPAHPTALIVFDAKRQANGREEAFLHPRPQDLVPLARWLRRAGARDLIVVTSHLAASLPQALKEGLSGDDEHEIVRSEFDRVAFVRAARAPAGGSSARWAQRLADGVLAQLSVMTPQPDQPVRAAKVAEFVAELAGQLPAATPGSRVAPPELVWMASQRVDPATLVRTWLSGGLLDEPSASRVRM